MNPLVALLLGIVQGLTEFIPVSSSGHLTLVPFILGLDEPTVTFDVATHFGTLVAVAWVFRERLARVLGTVRGWSRAPAEDRRLVTLLVVGTAPAAIIGAVFSSAIESAFQRPVLVSVLLGVTGYVLFTAEHDLDTRLVERRGEEEITPKDAAAMGLAQAAAILPGISRSGSTIATGIKLGLDREAAARFSFFLSIPIIFGATLAKIPDFLDAGLSADGAAFAIGAVTAGIVGALSIPWFLSIVQRKGMRPFGTYCFFLMVAGLITALARD